VGQVRVWKFDLWWRRQWSRRVVEVLLLHVAQAAVAGLHVWGGWQRRATPCLLVRPEM
jgi:hypothetical protein